ncbi:ATP-binding cassette domain-containing protein [Larsenimonas rhizosphaerae]|uniref:ATP-binding cassette domain-containing protein n=1 Tax=Larsenimonas rhizosphaerae TaxID=2944682 RepID=UPI0020333A9F|nr:ATP-binding cassette domain-containing protein [Larsenimonas rhizosphaerae]MCM2129562.1 ATP-binding cassette domain-containing protein [Larsenimonas rhizosphaerae]
MSGPATLSPLSVYHGSLRLLDRISLCLTPGRTVALVGQSGAGKSLTAAALAGALPPTLTREGGVLSTRDGRMPQVASLLQNPRSAFNPLMTMEAHALETLATVGVRGHAARQRIAAALEDAGLAPEVRNTYAFELSGGMLQRMMLALGLMQQASFLIADEPTSDLDPRSCQRSLSLIETVVREHGMGVLLITHDLGVVNACADEVHVISEGRLVESTTPETLCRAPSSDAARRLLAAHHALYDEEPL